MHVGIITRGGCGLEVAGRAQVLREVPSKPAAKQAYPPATLLHRPKLLLGSLRPSPFSSEQAAAMWKDLYGCSSDADKQIWADATTTCSALCGGEGEQLELCGMKGVGHDLNNPFQGYPFTVAWWVDQIYIGCHRWCDRHCVDDPASACHAPEYSTCLLRTVGRAALLDAQALHLATTSAEVS